MYFTIIGTVSSIETIAAGAGIRERARLAKLYGRGRWLKRKGVADVRLASGDLLRAALHWYECAGIGKREFKIKRFLEGNLT
jgi:TPR repeat protein